MGRGLLVTELLGRGINYVTGDYSRAARPVTGSRTARSPIRSRKSPSPATSKAMLAGIVAVGNDVQVRGTEADRLDPDRPDDHRRRMSD